jgi:hypothetical protein
VIAAALAGLWELGDDGDRAPGPVVLVLTSAGIKWPHLIAEIFPDPPLHSVEALSGRLARPLTLPAAADV